MAPPRGLSTPRDLQAKNEITRFGKSEPKDRCIQWKNANGYKQNFVWGFRNPYSGQFELEAGERKAENTEKITEEEEEEEVEKNEVRAEKTEKTTST